MTPSLASDSAKPRTQTGQKEQRTKGKKLGVMARAYHPTLRKVGQWNPKFKASLDYIVRFKKKGLK